MKYILFWSFVVTLGLSCNKDTDTQTGSGCIDRLVIPVTSHGTMTDADYNLVTALFASNGINNPTFRYTRTYRDSVQTYNGMHDFRNVFIIQYANGLPIFTESLNYLFKNGVFNSYSGTLSAGTTLNTTSVSSLKQLRKLFLNDMESFEHIGSLYRDSCFNAEFGYFNLNMGISYAPELLVKAWHVTTKSKLYPEAYYKDGSGERIYYSNGIVSFK